ncbi:BrnT family toxin [bacterium]|nr:BrnT family toxin [bacterium]MBU1614321.1 BrnT family toxin [bacterium]
MRIRDFEWDDGNILHLELIHGIQLYEAEEAIVHKPLFRKVKKAKYAAFGYTLDGRYLVLVFQKKSKGKIRVVTGWDMDEKERRYYKREREK